MQKLFNVYHCIQKVKLLHHLSLQLIKPTKTRIQKFRIPWRNSYLLPGFAEKKEIEIDRITSNQSKYCTFKLICQSSVCGWNLFTFITASMRCDIEPISLQHCLGVTEAQIALMFAVSSSLLWGLVPLIFLWIIHHRFLVGLLVWKVGWPVKRCDGMGIQPGFGMGRGQVLLENEICISIQILRNLQGLQSSPHWTKLRQLNQSEAI